MTFWAGINEKDTDRSEGVSFPKPGICHPGARGIWGRNVLCYEAATHIGGCLATSVPSAHSMPLIFARCEDQKWLQTFWNVPWETHQHPLLLRTTVLDHEKSLMNKHSPPMWLENSYMPVPVSVCLSVSISQTVWEHTATYVLFGSPLSGSTQLFFLKGHTPPSDVWGPSMRPRLSYTVRAVRGSACVSHSPRTSAFHILFQSKLLSRLPSTGKLIGTFTPESPQMLITYSQRLKVFPRRQ